MLIITLFYLLSLFVLPIFLHCFYFSRRRTTISPMALSSTKRSDKDKSRRRIAPSSNPRRLIQLEFRNLVGRMNTVDVDSAGTIAEVKEAIFQKTCCPPDDQNLVFNGKHLDDSKRLKDYKIEGGETIVLSLRICGGNANFVGPNGGDMIEEFRHFICILKEEFDRAKEREGDSNSGELDAWIYMLKSPSGLHYGRDNEVGKHWYSSSMAMHNIFLDPAAPDEQKEAFIARLQKYLRKECSQGRQAQSVLREDIFGEFQMAEFNLKEKKSLGSKNSKLPGYNSEAWCLNFSTHADSEETKRFRLNNDIKESIHRDLGRYKKWSRKGWIDRAVERFHARAASSGGDDLPPGLEDDSFDDNGVHLIADDDGNGPTYGQANGDSMGRDAALVIDPNAPLEEAAPPVAAIVTPSDSSGIVSVSLFVVI